MSPLTVEISGATIVNPGVLGPVGKVGDNVAILRDRGTSLILGTATSDYTDIRTGKGLISVDQDNATSATVSFGAPQTVLTFTFTAEAQRAYKLEFGNRTTFSGATAVANYDITVNGGIVGQFRFTGSAIAGIYSGGVTYVGRYSDFDVECTVNLVLTSLVSATTVAQTGSTGGRRWLAVYDVGPVVAYLMSVPV
jgi:hypothetical protein